jgi:hypothetical protein
VRLVANGKTQVQPLVVKADPRVLADGVTVADLARQVQHNLRVRDAISAAKQLVARIDSVSKTDSTQRFASIRAQLVTVPGRYQQPMLIDQLQYLYGMTTSADQRIGADAVERLAELRSQLDDLLRRGPK